MKGDIHSFHMRHKGFIYYKRLQSYEVHKPLDHISLVHTWRALVAVDGVELVGVVEERARVAADLGLPDAAENVILTTQGTKTRMKMMRMQQIDVDDDEEGDEKG